MTEIIDQALVGAKTEKYQCQFFLIIEGRHPIDFKKLHAWLIKRWYFCKNSLARVYGDPISDILVKQEGNITRYRFAVEGVNVMQSLSGEACAKTTQEFLEARLEYFKKYIHVDTHNIRVRQFNPPI